MSKKDDALSIVARYLRKLARGAVFTPQEHKLMSDLCFLALPMRYRMDRKEIDAENEPKVEANCLHERDNLLERGHE